MDELHAAGPAPSRSLLAACREDDAVAADENGDSQQGSARSSISAISSQPERQDRLSTAGSTSSADLPGMSNEGSGSRRGSKESICSTDSGFGQGSDRPAIKKKETTRRRNKAHVSTACYPCKRAHLACETSRPCKRCVNLEKEDQCIDVAHKRRGRPRIKDTVASKAGPPLDSLNHFQTSVPAAAVQTTDVSPKRGPSLGIEGKFAERPNHIDLQPRSLSTDLRFGMQPGGGITPPISFESAAVTPGWHERRSSVSENSYMPGMGNYEVAPSVARPVTAALILSMDLVIIRATNDIASWLETTTDDLVHRSLTQLTRDDDLHHLHTLQQALTQDAADLLGVQPKIAQQLHPRALQDALAAYNTVELTAAGPRPYPVRQAGLTLRQKPAGLPHSSKASTHNYRPSQCRVGRLGIVIRIHTFTNISRSRLKSRLLSTHKKSTRRRREEKRRSHCRSWIRALIGQAQQLPLLPGSRLSHWKRIRRM
ncbi:hypothetical protein BCR37DRAFT_42157 [Protomyces lactucae-debilis]|uniref:Zn(2)-C6 fungal-type domain-containing protein n=1 Tax=Protomyces lactucae-debilis TaxID=2754530 RepID=A0A1Y2FDI5_PROLT|nr:uncharacterized protein BCR37DRAFT_42157 [Protomyces lactucae-debilis]ORY81376.1 hypothetical protein BCR37DRAFT_42157 [Protomyces lactucae-debilis]